jgi:hypothetical protein
MDRGMRNAQVAEWILSLVTTSERASATVGDLMENGAIGSAFRFWIGVLRTAFSLLWREFSGDSARMMGLAWRGTLLQVLIFLVLGIAFDFMGLLSGPSWRPTDSTWIANHSIVNVVGQALSVGLVLLVSFQVGCWMARRSPGRELAPVVAYTILSFILATVAGLIWDRQQSLSQFILGLAPGLAWNVLIETPTFAGAVWVRRKRLSH